MPPAVLLSTLSFPAPLHLYLSLSPSLSLCLSVSPLSLSLSVSPGLDDRLWEHSGDILQHHRRELRAESCY